MEKLLQNRALMEDLGCCKRAGRGLNRKRRGFAAALFMLSFHFLAGWEPDFLCAGNRIL